MQHTVECRNRMFRLLAPDGLDGRIDDIHRAPQRWRDEPVPVQHQPVSGSLGHWRIDRER